MNRKRWMMLAALLVVVVVGAAWWRARSAATAPKYRTAEADRGSIESVVSATGTVRPVVQVEIGSQVSGTVDKLHADFNSRVRAGQVIVELEKSSFRAREVQAEASVARAEASVKDAERGLARAQELFGRNYVSQADLDAASVAVELRKADLKQAQAQLEAAQVDLRHTTIRSPIDGVVISRSIDLGQTVAASLQAPKLFVIANDLSQMQVESRIDEADIGRLRPGLGVSFTVDAFPDRTFEGSVAQVRLEPITEQGVVTYTTVIQTRNPDQQLRPGMTANVTIKIERRDDVVRIPNAALRFRPAAEAGANARSAAGALAGGGAFSSANSGGGRSGRSEARASNVEAGGGARAAQGAGGRQGGPSGRRTSGGEAGGGRGGDGGATPALTPIYVLRDGKPERVMVEVGITDGSHTEVRGGALKPGDAVVVGNDSGTRNANANLQPPPGMGGFRGPGGGRRR